MITQLPPKSEHEPSPVLAAGTGKPYGSLLMLRPVSVTVPEPLVMFWSPFTCQNPSVFATSTALPAAS